MAQSIPYYRCLPLNSIVCFFSARYSPQLFLSTVDFLSFSLFLEFVSSVYYHRFVRFVFVEAWTYDWVSCLLFLLLLLFVKQARFDYKHIEILSNRVTHIHQRPNALHILLPAMICVEWIFFLHMRNTYTAMPNTLTRNIHNKSFTLFIYKVFRTSASRTLAAERSKIQHLVGPRESYEKLC